MNGLAKLLGVKEFNQWFNKAFENVKINDKNQDSGYGFP